MLLSRSLLKFFFRCLIIIGIISILLSSYEVFYEFQKLFPRITKSSISVEEEDHFRFHWRRERKARTAWWDIMKPCFHNMEWGQVKPGWDKNQRSDASMSSIIIQDLRPAGEYSRLFIETKTKDGRLKAFGGDSWRVYLRGPASIAATVFDHDNGTYEALFLVMEPGVYRVETHLDYSLCDGLRNPPPYWFIKGNSHGKFQEDGLLGFLDDYLQQQLPGDLSITIKPTRHDVDIQNILGPSPLCEECVHTFLYDGYGRWINGTWAPFLTPIYNTSTLTDRTTPTGTIISYGDSLALRFGISMASNKNIRKVYQRSTYRYNWIYPVGNEQVEIQRNDDLDLDIDRVVSYIKEVLEEPLYDRENSALVLNIGLHCVMSVNFSSYQILLEKVLDLLFVNQTLTSKGKLQPRYKTTVIWKTTTQIRKENGDSLNLTDVRFYTTQRVLLYNAYATWRMCRAGIPVLDVLPVTLSYPSGPIDVEHYPDHVFKQAEDALADFKRFHNNKSNRLTRTCIYT